ncbi:MAG TPA: ribosome maturation factor RimP [Clostridia bacterium]|nr:ribosome maturation factor RimP [Clostridia bacterium]
MKSISKVAEEILTPFLESKDLELYDLAFVKEGPHHYLRVFIDSEKGISLNECEEVSQFLSKALDKKDPFKKQYFLEVSSPGIERTLKKDDHYRRFIGHSIQLSLFSKFQDQKVINGKLLSKDNKYIKILDDITGKELEVPVDLVAKARTNIEF